MTKTAVDKSEFHPTRFEIYDLSTNDNCNRLIIIEPFNWIILAANDELYIINEEGAILCDSEQTGVIEILSRTDFRETCLSIKIDRLLDYYRNKCSKPTIIDYEIQTRRFTIFAALNILCDGFLTFGDQNNNAGYSYTNAPSVLSTMYPHLADVLRNSKYQKNRAKSFLTKISVIEDEEDKAAASDAVQKSNVTLDAIAMARGKRQSVFLKKYTAFIEPSEMPKHRQAMDSFSKRKNENKKRNELDIKAGANYENDYFS